MTPNIIVTIEDGRLVSGNLAGPRLLRNYADYVVPLSAGARIELTPALAAPERYTDNPGVIQLAKQIHAAEANVADAVEGFAVDAEEHLRPAVVIRRTAIAGTNIFVYSAWRYFGSVLLLRSAAGAPYHTIASAESFGDPRPGWYGKLGTERLPADLDALTPGSRERYARVTAWQSEQNSQAILAIEADPEVAASTFATVSGAEVTTSKPVVKGGR
jgi:hypothetical protein